MISNKRILLIGGTGALGQNLLKIYQDTNRIRVLSRDEHKQVNLISSGWVNNSTTSFMIGDVKDKDSILNAIEDYAPDIIINAASLKHVPVCEINPYESVNVNLIGHQNLLDCIRRSKHKVETVIYISSDKACKPVNIYGMCKAISERLYIEFAKSHTDIKICIVRYGNILESTGSVIPLFKKLLHNGAPTLPITDLRMTRFLLTLDNAVRLIEWAYIEPKSHGKIAVPKISSFKITDIAEVLISNYDKRATLEVVGIRKGEKIHEEMISSEEMMRTEILDNYLIGDTIISNNIQSYNSNDCVMNIKDVLTYLKKCNVI